MTSILLVKLLSIFNVFWTWFFLLIDDFKSYKIMWNSYRSIILFPKCKWILVWKQYSMRTSIYFTKDSPLFELAGNTKGGGGSVVIELPVKSTYSLNITFLSSHNILLDYYLWYMLYWTIVFNLKEYIHHK